MQGLRYNAGGILGQAAALAGSADTYNQRRGQDINFINDEYNRRAQLSEFAQTNALDAQKLQQAGQMMAQRGQTPTSSIGGNGQSPFTQAIINAKNLSLQAASGDLSPEEIASFRADSIDPKTNAVDFNNTLQKVVAAKKNTAAKVATVAAAKDLIDPEDQGMISAMTADPQFSPAHVMQAIHQSAQKKETKTKQASDFATKQSVWQNAQQDKTLTPEDRDSIAPLVSDPAIPAAQVQSRVATLRQQHAREANAAVGQKLASGRSAMSSMYTQAKQMEKDHQDLFGPGAPPPVDADEQAIFDQHKDLMTRAGAIRDGLAAQFTQTRTNPNTGHRVGQMPDGSWVDAINLDPVFDQFGKAVQQASTQPSAQ